MSTFRIFRYTVHIEKSIVWFELALVLAFFVLYAYSIVTSVVNVVLREELQVAVREADSRVGELEATYLALVHTLTEERATELGLVKLGQVTYVDVTRSGALTRRD